MSVAEESADFKFTLENNAIDSLAYAATFFANRKVKSELKLAVLLAFHAIELLFKAKLSSFDRDLIFSDKSKKKTIKFDAAKGYLIKRGIRFSKTENKTLNVLRELRDDLEHHELESNVSHVEACVRGALKFADAFSERELNISLRDHLGARKYNRIVSTVYDKAEQMFKKVIDRVSKSRHKSYQYWSCPNCGEDELVVPDPVKHNDKAQCSNCGRMFFISACIECSEHVILPQSFGIGSELFHCGCPTDGESELPPG